MTSIGIAGSLGIRLSVPYRGARPLSASLQTKDTGQVGGEGVELTGRQSWQAAKPILVTRDVVVPVGFWLETASKGPTNRTLPDETRPDRTGPDR
ncbi:unnamed protein product, partial [Protopolystoma xenopodis]